MIWGKLDGKGILTFSSDEFGRLWIDVKKLDRRRDKTVLVARKKYIYASDRDGYWRIKVGEIVSGGKFKVNHVEIGGHEFGYGDVEIAVIHDANDRRIVRESMSVKASKKDAKAFGPEHVVFVDKKAGKMLMRYNRFAPPVEIEVVRVERSDIDFSVTALCRAPLVFDEVPTQRIAPSKTKTRIIVKVPYPVGHAPATGGEPEMLYQTEYLYLSTNRTDVGFRWDEVYRFLTDIWLRERDAGAKQGEVE